MKKILGWIGGGVVGFVSGFFGGGGGMICVPLLQKGMRQNAKVAHETAMPVILPVSVFSAITYAIEVFFKRVFFFFRRVFDTLHF